MHLIVAINNNIHEWRDTLGQSRDCPRLPLPYAFGAAFIKRGHQVSAVDLCSKATKAGPIDPFQAIYYENEILDAMKKVDLAAFWGAHGISAILKQSMLSSPRRRVLLNSYVWDLGALPSWQSRKLCLATKLASRFARGLVVMTSEQSELARKTLPDRVPVLKLNCGIDTAFYRVQPDISDIPECHRSVIDTLLTDPYVIMPGDELRCTDDALDIIENSNFRIVRISQYSDKSRPDLLKQEIRRRRLAERFIVFEKISYRFMRFLFHHASVYAGLVDSTWQPAGWTVTSEALASGLPVVLYEGLVSRELTRLGAGQEILHTVPMRDIRAFQSELELLLDRNSQEKVAEAAEKFASQHLDLEKTSPDFVRQVEQLMVQ